MLRYQKNVGATTPEARKVEEIIQGRFVHFHVIFRMTLILLRLIYAILILLKRFNADKVKYSQPFTRDMHKLTELIGGYNGRHMLDVFFLVSACGMARRSAVWTNANSE